MNYRLAFIPRIDWTVFSKLGEQGRQDYMIAALQNEQPAAGPNVSVICLEDGMPIRIPDSCLTGKEK